MYYWKQICRLSLGNCKEATSSLKILNHAWKRVIYSAILQKVVLKCLWIISEGNSLLQKQYTKAYDFFWHSWSRWPLSYCTIITTKCLLFIWCNYHCLLIFVHNLYIACILLCRCDKEWVWAVMLHVDNDTKVISTQMNIEAALVHVPCSRGLAV